MANMFETKLPPEMRLEVYKHLLATDHRLTRVGPTECRELLAQTSILETNKLIFKEAVEVFRDVNNFAVPLRELCQRCNPTGESKSAALLKKSGTVTVVAEGCGHCCQGTLLALFRSLEGRDFDVVMMDSSLPFALGHGATTTKSKVGSLAYNFKSGASLTCRYPAISCAFNYIMTLPPDQAPELGLQDARHYRPDVKASFRRGLCSILEALLQWHPYDGPGVSMLRGYEAAYLICRGPTNPSANPRAAIDTTLWLKRYLT
ncbi:hypothetical protein LTR56_009960 [Elasticomyces elasticus]|nr:hypothetical protein LTR56_009960 [Elasticomyces elasticus]KAK3656192.1 hypothetical protein LTR22_009899 [Elasticomyces elasticus]KAK4933747.1 hypothetical protein LTR49_000213 [Elasticomyces elasticus]KAK5756537.1 hypothetical protein LTS12_013372 [Elasticomyces elasticus]